MQKVEIEWLDSASLEGWMELEEAMTLKPMKIISCGYLIKEDVDAYSLAPSLNNSSKDIDYVLCIPKFAVTKVRKLSVCK